VPCVALHLFQCVGECVVTVDDGGHVPVTDRLHGAQLGSVAARAQRTSLSQQPALDHLATAFVDARIERFASGVDREVDHAKRAIAKRVKAAPRGCQFALLAELECANHAARVIGVNLGGCYAIGNLQPTVKSIRVSSLHGSRVLGFERFAKLGVGCTRVEQTLEKGSNVKSGAACQYREFLPREQLASDLSGISLIQPGVVLDVRGDYIEHVMRDPRALR